MLKKRKILIGLLVASTLFTIAGCKSNTVGNTGVSQEELDEKAPNFGIENDEIIHGNYGDHMTYDEKLQFEQLVREMNDDLKKIVFDNNDKNYGEIDLQAFKEKYIVADETNTAIKDLYNNYKNIFDGFDGTIDNKLNTSKTDYLYDVNGGFFDSQQFKSIFTEVTSDGWSKLNNEDYTKNAILTSSLKNEDMLFTFVGDKYFEQNLGLFAKGTSTQLKNEGYSFLLSDTQIPVILVDLAYDFDTLYPSIDGTATERLNKGGNHLEIMFVKANDNWKVMISKFVNSTTSNIEILSQEDNYLNQKELGGN